VFTLGGHAGAVSGVSLLWDNRFVLSSSLDNTVRLWDLRLLGAVATFAGHTKAATSVAAARDGCYAVTTGRDESTLLWRLPSYFKK
jgi:WD40 repeat protein